MRKPISALDPNDTEAYVEAAITADGAKVSLQLTMRRLQAKYKFGERGGIDLSTGRIQSSAGLLSVKMVSKEELETLVSAHEAAELATLEWQDLLLRLRQKYNAPMLAAPDDNGDWLLNGANLTAAPQLPSMPPAAQAAGNGKRSRKGRRRG